MSPAGALMGKVAMVVAAVCLAGGVTYAATRSDDDPAAQELVTGAPDAWIDAPVHGAVLPEGTVEVVTHAASPAGIARIDLSVEPSGGGEGEDQSADAGGGALELATFAWTPPGPGSYVLSVHGTDGDGNTTGTARSTVEIVAGTGTTAGTTPGTIPAIELGTTSSSSSSTSTTAPNPSTPSTVRPTTPTTPRPTTPTTSPTTPTTVCPPTLTSPTNDSATTDKTPQLKWAACGGNPGEFLVQVATDPGFASNKIVIDEPVGGNERTFDVPDPLPCSTTYYWRVAADTSWSVTWRFHLICT